MIRVRLRYIVAVGLAALIGKSAAASEWWYVTAGADGDVYFVDVASIAHQGISATYWDYDIYKTPVRQTISQKNHYSLDCSTRKSIRLAGVEYGASGTVEGTSGRLTPVDIAPDTVGDVLSQFVCGTVADRARRGTKLSLSPEETALRLFAVTDAPK